MIFYPSHFYNDKAVALNSLSLNLALPSLIVSIIIASNKKDLLYALLALN